MYIYILYYALIYVLLYSKFVAKSCQISIYTIHIYSMSTASKKICRISKTGHGMGDGLLSGHGASLMRTDIVAHFLDIVTFQVL
jgi:hypothetical protein